MKRLVKIGDKITLGDGRIYVQSMLSVPSYDIEGNVSQALALQAAGCEIIRVAIPDKAAVALIPKIKERVSIPLVADIHFDYRLAVESVAAGVDKIRINPGNIGDDDRIKAVVDSCRTASVPIRIGVNSGSLEKDILASHGGVTPTAMVESALRHVRILERFDFYDTVISMKSADVACMIAAYRELNDLCEYPLHLGVTEAGTYKLGVIKSAIGIGSLLIDGIGDTIRVSLTDDPIKEVECGYNILKAAGIKSSRPMVNVISCPTCGRTRVNLIEIANRAEELLSNIEKDITVAIMGCVVNGPGEAAAADIGIAGGDGAAVLFKKGKVIKKLDEQDILKVLMEEIERM